MGRNREPGRRARSVSQGCPGQDAAQEPGHRSDFQHHGQDLPTQGSGGPPIGSGRQGLGSGPAAPGTPEPGGLGSQLSALLGRLLRPHPSSSLALKPRPGACECSKAVACTPRAPSLRLGRAAEAQPWDPEVQALDDGLGPLPSFACVQGPVRTRPWLQSPPLASRGQSPRLEGAAQGRRAGFWDFASTLTQAPRGPDLRAPRARRPTAKTPRRAPLGPPQTTVPGGRRRGLGTRAARGGAGCTHIKAPLLPLISGVWLAVFPRPRPANLLSRRAPLAQLLAG